MLHLLGNAGQGYIWLAHRQPNSPGWAIAQRSKQLWESMIGAAETPAKNGHRSKKLGRKADIEWQVTPLHGIIWLCSTQLCCLLAFRAATQVLLSCLSHRCLSSEHDTMRRSLKLSTTKLCGHTLKHCFCLNVMVIALMTAMMIALYTDCVYKPALKHVMPRRLFPMPPFVHN